MKKGFTLIELLSVIVVIALISLIMITTVSRQVKEGKNEIGSSQIETIKLSAELWGSENKNILKKQTECFSIKLSALQMQGYIDEKLKNPTTNKLITDDDIVINITPESNRYKYEVLTNTTDKCMEITLNEEEE